MKEQTFGFITDGDLTGAAIVIGPTVRLTDEQAGFKFTGHSYVPVSSHEDYKARAQQGIRSSINHAEADVPGWGEMALGYLARHAALKLTPWTMESFRMWAIACGLAEPPDARAFGAVTRAAIRQGIIRKTGQYAPAASSNGSPKPLYVGCV